MDKYCREIVSSERCHFRYHRIMVTANQLFGHSPSHYHWLDAYDTSIIS